MPAQLFRKDLDHILDHTRDLWEDLRGERIFITGGTGFFGIWLLESFLWANDQLNLGAQAVVLTRFPSKFQHKAPHLASASAVSLYTGDVRQFAFPPGPFFAVIHAAGESSNNLASDDLLVMLDTIANGTRCTLEGAIQNKVKRFLFTSSGAVYGPHPHSQERLTEDTPHWDYPGVPDMSLVYRQGKRLAELLCAIYTQSGQIEACIARCFAFVGPHLPLDAHFAIGNFIRDALKGQPIKVRGDGTPYRSYLYAADLAIWLWTILMKGLSGQAYNVGADEALQIAALAQIIAQSVHPPVPVHIRNTPVLGQPPERYIPSTDLARRSLGLDTWIPLPEALDRTFKWFLNNAVNYDH